jgi:thiol-disulfide isomerase/thioredoxin
MSRNTRNLLVLVVIAAIAVVGWLVNPSPFSHGVIVGFLATLGSLLAGIVVLTLVMRKRRGDGLDPPPLPVGSWDYAMDLTDLDGAPVAPSQWSGKILVLNFWATWCAPCVREMPSLQRLLEKTADLDVLFAFITREDPAVVRPFVAKRNLDLPIYVLEGEPPECFKTRGIPATFIIGRSGGIAMQHVGAAAWDADNIVAFIRGLASKP